MIYGNICETCGLDKDIIPTNCDICRELSLKNKRIQRFGIALCAVSTFGFFIKIVFL